MNTVCHDMVHWSRRGVRRRRFLRTASLAGLAAGSLNLRELVSLKAG